MKRFLRLTRLFVCLCAVLSSTTAFAAATEIKNSYIIINGTWYNGSGTTESAYFNNHDFGFVTSLTIGGKIDTQVSEVESR